MTTINISEEKTKKCVKCGEIKLLSEYYKKECNSDGLFHYCKRGTPRGKLNENISTRMYQFLKSAKQNKHWEEFVPYTLDDLKLHLEKQFDEKMNWENYGLYWEVDHKIPISVFNFECPQDIDFGKCWSLKNLRPLEKSKNRAKRNTLEEPFQPSLMLRF